MRKLVCSALALTAATAPGFASETDWLSLDSELEALSATLADNGNAHFGGYIITSFNYVDDGDSTSGDNQNSADFAVNKARVYAKKSWDNGYSVKVQGDFAASTDGTYDDGDDATDDSVEGGFGGFSIKDAYVRFPAGNLQGQIGNFKTPFLRSGLVSSSQQFFLTRTENGGDWSDRDTGAQINGNFDKLDYTVAAMNSDAGDTKFLISARIYVAVAYADDDASFDEGETAGLDHNALGFEIHAVTNTYSISFESVTYGNGGLDDYGPAQAADPADAAETSPISGTATYMLTPETWELGIRYDDMDDAGDTNKITVGANHYLNGHGLKWTYQYEMISTDSTSRSEDNIFRIGLTASF
ncbi:MAG: hypothetical protein ACI841_002224 [Planctomycetota bacterium]|jgi:hypothetical protein